MAIVEVSEKIIKVCIVKINSRDLPLQQTMTIYATLVEVYPTYIGHRWLLIQPVVKQELFF